MTREDYINTLEDVYDKYYLIFNRRGNVKNEK